MNIQSLPNFNFNFTCDLLLVTAQGGSCAVATVCEVPIHAFLQNNNLQSNKSFLTAVSKSYIPSLWLQSVFCPSGCKSTYRGGQAEGKLNSPSAYQESLEEGRFYIRTGHSFLFVNLSLQYQLLTLPKGWAAAWTKSPCSNAMCYKPWVWTSAAVHLE